MAKERRRIVYRGRVQGVGFRASVHRLSPGFAVAGFVRNQPDGSVEVVVSGDPEDLDRFHEAIARAFAAKIRDVEISPILEEFDEPSGFSIRY